MPRPPASSAVLESEGAALVVTFSRTPVRDPGRNITQPDPRFPDRAVKVIRLRPAEFVAFPGEHAA
ncbi:MAG TPA: hypothetical protein VKG61_03615, partial [Streptosporangiaceae bacterium]|nr:hypothetical protein [Streptosporangiaceae bacterium]